MYFAGPQTDSTGVAFTLLAAIGGPRAAAQMQREATNATVRGAIPPQLPGAAPATTGRPPLRNPVTGETMEIIPPRQRVNQIDPTAPNPVRPSNATMGGRPFPTWGRDHIGWGTGPEGALDRISTITQQELVQQGVTREQVIAARDFYMAEFRQNAGNQSAAARVQLMNHILTLLP